MAAATQKPQGPLTFLPASGVTSLPVGALVKLAAGTDTVTLAGAGERPIGVIQGTAWPHYTGQSRTSSPYPSIAPLNSTAQIICLAAGAITVGSSVYSAANGKVSTTDSGVLIGTAVTAATGDGSLVSVIPALRGADVGQDDDTYGFGDDFMDAYVTTNKWTTAGDAGGSVASATGAGGIVVITTDTNANDQKGFHNGVKSFKFAAGKPGWLSFRVKVTEANTNDAALFVGLSDTFTDIVADGGASFTTAAKCFGLGKLKDATTMRAFASDGTTPVNVTADMGNFTTATWYKVLVTWTDDGTTITFSMFIDGVLKNTLALPLAAAAEMYLMANIKGAGAAEVLTLDWLKAYIAR